MRPVASGVNEKVNTAILLFARVSRGARGWMVHVVQLTSLARGASLCPRCSRLHLPSSSDQCQRQHQQLHQSYNLFQLLFHKINIIHQIDIIQIVDSVARDGKQRGWHASSRSVSSSLSGAVEQTRFRHAV